MPPLQAYTELTDFWQLPVTFQDLLPCLDTSSAASMNALSHCKAQVLWQRVQRGLQQLRDAHGADFLQQGFATFIMTPAVDSSSLNAALQLPALRALHWLPLTRAVVRRIDEQGRLILPRQPKQQGQQGQQGQYQAAGLGRTSSLGRTSPPQVVSMQGSMLRMDQDAFALYPEIEYASCGQFRDPAVLLSCSMGAADDPLVISTKQGLLQQLSAAPDAADADSGGDDSDDATDAGVVLLRSISLSESSKVDAAAANVGLPAAAAIALQRTAASAGFQLDMGPVDLISGVDGKPTSVVLLVLSWLLGGCA